MTVLEGMKRFMKIWDRTTCCIGSRYAHLSSTAVLLVVKMCDNVIIIALVVVETRVNLNHMIVMLGTLVHAVDTVGHACVKRRFHVKISWSQDGFIQM